MQTQKFFDVEAALAANARQEDIDLFMKQNGLFPLPKERVQTIPENAPRPELPPGLGFSRGLEAPSSLGNMLKNLQLPLSLGIGAGAGLLTKNPLIGNAASVATDTLINKFIGTPDTHPISGTMGFRPTGDPLIDAITSTGENVLVNEGLGWGVGKGLKSLSNIVKEADIGSKWLPKKEIIGNIAIGTQKGVANLRDKLLNVFDPSKLADVGAGSVTGDISTLKPTFNQLQMVRGKSGGFSGLAEDMFARGAKNKALVGSAAQTFKEAETLAKNISSRKFLKLDNIDQMANSIQMKAQVNYDNIQDHIKDIDTDLKLAREVMFQNPKDPLLQVNVKSLEHDKEQLHTALNDVFPTNRSGQIGPKTSDYLPRTSTGLSLNKPNSITDEILYDAKKMENLFAGGQVKYAGKILSSANPKKDLQGYGFMKFIDDATDHAGGILDATSLRDSWNAYKVSDAAKKLYNNQQINDITNFFDKVQYVATPIGQKGASKYLTLRLGTATAAFGGGLISAIAGGQMRGVQTAGAIVGGAIGMHQLGKLMTNPDTARLMIAAVSGGPLNMAPAVASRLIAKALRGQPMTLETKDPNGNDIKIAGKINSIGKFEIPEERKISAKY